MAIDVLTRKKQEGEKVSMSSSCNDHNHDQDSKYSLRLSETFFCNLYLSYSNSLNLKSFSSKEDLITTIG